MLLKNEKIGGPDHDSNPLRFNPETQSWGFWNETWTEWTDGFASQALASTALLEYARSV